MQEPVIMLLMEYHHNYVSTIVGYSPKVRSNTVRTKILNYYSAPVGERSIAISLSVCVCLSASISLKSLVRSSRNFLRRYPVAVAQSSSGGVAICCVLPVYGLHHVWPYIGPYGDAL